MSFQELPPEIISEVVAHLPTARSVANLGRTSRFIRQIVNEDGWKSFVQARFPSNSVAGDWKTAAHSLTTLSRNFDRKAFIARYIHPSQRILHMPEGITHDMWRPQGGQTMGYQPVIDSYEIPTGTQWNQRQEVVAWGAGSQLVIRSRDLHRDCQQEQGQPIPNYKDRDGYATSWVVWKPSDVREGVDDITCMKLLPEQYGDPRSSSSNQVHLIHGTASGQLSLRALPTSYSHNMDIHELVSQEFVTAGSPVKSLDVSSLQSQLLVAGLADEKISLFSTSRIRLRNNNQDSIQPISSIAMHPDGNEAILWTTCFLTDASLAVGAGRSAQPIHVYNVTPTGVNPAPIRRFRITDNLTSSPRQLLSKSSVYAIKPLPWTSSATHRPGEVFLSGGSDGIIRLHDVRSPAEFECKYSTPNSSSRIYSLAVLGRERVVAGCAQHSAINIFDLRVPGGREYHYLNHMGTALPQDTTGSVIWLNPRGESRYARPRGGGHHRWSRRAANSPVYSVSSPSPTSPFIYAGVENNVVELAFTSYCDPHPDTIFPPAETFKNDPAVVNLPTSDDTLQLRLAHQKPLSRTRRGQAIPGYDERLEIPSFETWQPFVRRIGRT